MPENKTYKLGTKVENVVGFPSIPVGTVGYIVEDYGTGIWIAWDLHHKPYPHDLSFEEVGSMAAINPRCPIRDGFDKQTELDYLKIFEE